MNRQTPKATTATISRKEESILRLVLDFDADYRTILPSLAKVS